MSVRDDIQARRQLMHEKARLDQYNKNQGYQANENLAKKKFKWQTEAKSQLSEQQILGQIELTKLEHALEPEKLQRECSHASKMMNLEIQKFISEQHITHFQELAKHKSLSLWSTFEKLIPTALEFKHRKEKEKLDSEIRMQEEKQRSELQKESKTHEVDQEIREFEAKEKIKVIMDLYRQKLGLGNDNVSDDKLEEIIATVQAFNAKEFPETKGNKD